MSDILLLYSYNYVKVVDIFSSRYLPGSSLPRETSMYSCVPIQLMALILSMVVAGLPHASASTLFRISDIHFDPFYGCDASKENCSKTLQALASTDGSGAFTGWLTDPAQWDKAFDTLCAQQPDHHQCDAITHSNSHSHVHFGDTNYRSLDLAMRTAALRVASENPDFTLYTGDFLAHDFGSNYGTYNNCPAVWDAAPCSQESYQQFVDQTLKYVLWKVRQAVDVPLYAALGNNDAYCGDYWVSGNSGFLGNTADLLDHMAAPFDDGQKAHFEEGGYYAVDLSATHRMVVLNTNIYTSKYHQFTRNPNTCSNPAPLDNGTFEIPTDLSRWDRPAVSNQFTWLINELLTARGKKKLWLMMHVPPGIDAYDGETYLMAEDANTNFSALLSHPSLAPTIAGVLAGHTHENEFKLIRDENGQVAGHVLIAPGVDGDHGNASAYQLFTYDGGKSLVQDYTTYTNQHGTWRVLTDAQNQPMTFRDAFATAIFDQQSGENPEFASAADVVVNSHSLELLFDALKAGGGIRDVYENLYHTGDGGTFYWSDQEPALCGLIHWQTPC